MKRLFDDPQRMFSLLDDRGVLVLDVVVGTIALYTVQRRLTEEEKSRYAADGKPYLDALAAEVVRQPNRWPPGP